MRVSHCCRTWQKVFRVPLLQKKIKSDYSCSHNKLSCTLVPLYNLCVFIVPYWLKMQLICAWKNTRTGQSYYHDDTDLSVIAQHKKKGSFSLFVHLTIVCLRFFFLKKPILSLKICFANIRTLWNRTFFSPLFSFVSGSEAENDSQIQSELLNGLAGWLSAIYFESQRGL